LSIFPETFSLTFFECVEAEIPFVITKGGFPAQVCKTYDLFLRNYTVKAAIRLINNIDSENLLNEAQSQIVDFKRKNWDKMRKKTQKKFNFIKKYI
jgi:hypothetical protein